MGIFGMSDMSGLGCPLQIQSPRSRRSRTGWNEDCKMQVIVFLRVSCRTQNGPFVSPSSTLSIVIVSPIGFFIERVHERKSNLRPSMI